MRASFILEPVSIIAGAAAKAVTRRRPAILSSTGKGNLTTPPRIKEANGLSHLFRPILVSLSYRFIQASAPLLQAAILSGAPASSCPSNYGARNFASLLASAIMVIIDGKPGEVGSTLASQTKRLSMSV